MVISKRQSQKIHSEFNKHFSPNSNKESMKLVADIRIKCPIKKFEWYLIGSELITLAWLAVK